MSVRVFGENYALNDRVTIAGSNIGGTDVQNDATLTMTTVGATTLTNIIQTSTSGNGNGATFTISIDGIGNYNVLSIAFNAITVEVSVLGVAATGPEGEP